MAETGLVKKLRLQSGQQALILNAPPGYLDSLEGLPEGIKFSEAYGEKYDFVQIFLKDSTQFAEQIQNALQAVKYDGLLWLSYPKKSAKVATDLSRDVVWKLMDGTGYRPVAQIALDEVWSALRFRPSELVGK